MSGLRLPPVTPGAKLLGFGSYQPGRVVTNTELAQQVDTTDEWIRSRVGIESRRFASEQESVVSMGAEAGSKALADAGIVPSDLDAVVVATCTMPKPIPNAAAQTSDHIGINAIAAYDVNAACAGFCYGVGLGADMIRAGNARHVLVIGSEKLTDWLDFEDRSTCIIFADGAGATVLGPADDADDVGVGPYVLGAAGDLVSTIHIDTTDALRQEGQSVFRWATTRIAPVALRAVQAAGLTPADVDVLVPHQANLRIVEAIAKKLRREGAREDLRVADDIIGSGNTSSASIPMAIDHMRAAGRVRSGDVALLVGFGAGLSYGAQVVVLP